MRESLEGPSPIKTWSTLPSPQETVNVYLGVFRLQMGYSLVTVCVAGSDPPEAPPTPREGPPPVGGPSIPSSPEVWPSVGKVPVSL